MNKPTPDILAILEQYAKLIIENVEHGIYIPLPSPRAEQAITDYYLGLLPEKKESSDPKWHNEMHPPEPDEDEEISFATSEKILRSENDGFNQCRNLMEASIRGGGR